MTDNEIVLNLLDFYKRRGIDLHKIIDDPLFNSLTLPTKVKAIQTYADRILHGTPAGLGKNDFRSILKSFIVQSGIGAISGGIAAAGIAKAFNNGKVPVDALVTGAIFGGVGGLTNASIGAMTRANIRSGIRNELQNTVNDPTENNALNVLSAVHLGKTEESSMNTILNKINQSVEKNLEKARSDQLTNVTEDYNFHIGNTKMH